MIIQHDGALDIAVGKWRKETNWQNKSVSWSTLLSKLMQTTRTPEKYAAYISSKKDRQAEIKDVGGFVGGYMNRGRRKSGSVQHRQLITLDVDFASTDFWADFQLTFSCSAAMYTTHAHCPEKPRYRLLIPLDREVFCDEYVAISRWIAGHLGIDLFDDTTYQPERLMYWPSTSTDGEFIFEHQEGAWLSADKILGKYRDWKDSSAWPISSRHKDQIIRDTKKAGDPLEKPGVIGAWCKSYTITDVLEKFLDDVYEATDFEDRYTFIHGSTAAGLVIYDDKFAYSHHGTDPISQRLCNAFDLVRIHKFGIKDEEAPEGVPINKLPSYVAMVDFARKDGMVRVQLVNDQLEVAHRAFEDVYIPETGETEHFESQEVKEVESSAEPADDSWKEQLDIDKKGNLQSTIDNIVLVLENDPLLKGCFAWDEFENRPIALRRLPWRSIIGPGAKYLRETDDANLAHYLEKAYDISNIGKTKQALLVLFERYRRHPVREYLKSLKWDGVPRVDTLLIDYLGVKDNEFIRTVTRKALAAAVARVHEPGCKFDYLLTLIGDQGDKKSTLLSKLGGLWFSDSLSTVQGKEAAEQLQGVWLVEVAEIAAFKRAEVEQVKHFTSKQVDRFRPSYGHYSANYYRQCVFFPTTNKRDFLQDITGNRRFWPGETDKALRIKDPAELSVSEVGQIWAEAVQIYQAGELLYLSDEMEEIAKQIQMAHMEQDDRRQMVIDYLERLLPDNWEEMNVMDRRGFLAGNNELFATRQRTRVSIGEIWTECLGCLPKDMTRFNTGPIHGIMASLPGWEKYQSKMKSSTYGVQRGYVRKGLSMIGYSHVPAKM